MDDEGPAARGRDGLDELLQEGVFLGIVDADPAFHGDRDRDGPPHGGDALGDDPGHRHQAGAEVGFLDPVGRAAAIQVDFVITGCGAEFRAAGEGIRVAPAQLQRDRVLGRIEAQETRAVAVDQGARRDHLRVQPRALRQQAQEIAVVPVRALHHWGHTEPV
jgi:hypothetical protein